MKAVVVGDLSFRGRYHLGDEAMSQVAVNELSRRGVSVTLVAGTPKVTSALYDVPAVGRFGFVGIPQRDDKVSFMELILAGVRGEAALPASAVASVESLREADALIIAGGGNLNTIGEHHVFERLTLARIARELGIPLYVSSQTVGPHLLPPDQELVQEIAGIARVFGVRESNSAVLMRGLCGSNAHIVRTVDDAILLEPQLLAQEIREKLPERYVIASFAADSQTSGLDAEEYYRELARIVDETIDSANADVLLVSHLGELASSSSDLPGSDDHAHRRVAAYVQSNRVRVMPMIAASALLDLTSSALFTISTRYHPLVFGPAVGVPAVGIVHSYYSAVRMRGALKNSGMEDLAIPLEYWKGTLGTSVLKALNSDLIGFADHARHVGAEQQHFQRSWWDWIVADIAEEQPPIPEDFIPARGSSDFAQLWRAELTQARVVSEAIHRDRLQMQITDRYTDIQRRRDARDHARLRNDIATAQKEIEELRAEVQELRHRVRPPGAAIRDRLRHSVHEFRRSFRGQR